jgi:hypothetical protein
MNMLAMKVLSFLVFIVVAVSSIAQVSLSTINSPYTQDFNALANTGTSTALPTGWFLNEAGGNTSYAAGTGSDNTGNTYSFGATSNSERAFGGLLSGSVNPTIGASFTNNTGATITSLDISYIGEQWRLGATGRFDQIDFQYSLNATSLTSGTWTDVNSLDFIAPNSTGTVGALNGNAAANRTSISNSITGLSIANGVTFWIRWTDFNASGSDDGLGVDDFSLTPIGVSGPELNLQTSATSSACGFTHNFGSVLTSSSGTVALTIQNTGTADLTISSLALSGSTDYTLNSPPATSFTIAAGGSQVINIDFNPTSGGTITGALTIGNNDSDEGSCVVNLTGVGVVPAPELNLQTSATNRACGFTHNFGNVLTTNSGTVALTIQNTGTADLTISSLALSGSSDYSLNSPPALPFTIVAGASQVINIHFNPTSGGTITGALTIGNNDSDEGSCVVNLTGVGVVPAPELNLQTSSTNRACGFTHNFGSVLTSNSGTVALTIQNTGTADLTISSLALSGSSDYSLNSPPALPFTIVAGASQVINIDFNPTSGGTITGALTIGNNDSDEGSCVVNLTGVGIVPVPCSDLFFSEYVEGSSNNKYLEIYNPTNTSINLANYQVRLYSNGSGTVSNTVTLDGTLTPGGVYIMAHNLATIYSGTINSSNSSVMTFNGDDAIELFNTVTSSTIDIIGRIGEDPGAAWTGGGLSTENRTLIRNATVTTGVLINPSSGFPTLTTEWTGLAIDNVSNLGTHNASSCISNNLTISALSSLNYSVSCTTNDAGTIDYSYSGTFNSGNTLTLQLSDPFGNFASPTVIFTTTTTTSSGTLNFTIPVGTTAGTSYRLRLLSSNPSITTNNNGSDITIVNTDGSCIDPDLCAQIIQFQVDPRDGANGTATNTGEFIQLCNVCTEQVDISCYLLCFTDNNSGARRGECFRIPSGTLLAPGECYLMGGNGTTTTTDPAADWDGASVTLDLNWHTCGTCVSPLNGSSGFVGVLTDGGEDITFFNESGNLISAITYNGSGGATYSESFTIGASGTCPITSITIPSSTDHFNVGTTPSADPNQQFDEGWLFDCATQTWFFADADFSGGPDTDPDLNPNLVYGCPLITPLPVELYAFYGYKNDNINDIYWITNTERNNSHFTLYKSNNGIDFEFLASIQGAGNSTTRKTYIFNDVAASQGTYYRLEQHDYDGNSKMYNTIYLPSVLEDFIVFPNPTSGNFTIISSNSEIGESIYIYDTFGKIIHQCWIEDKKTAIDLSNVNPGIYLIEVGTKFIRIIVY